MTAKDMTGRRKTSTGPATTAVHGPNHAEWAPGRPVVTPMAQSSTFYWADPSDGELRYTRYSNNPNQLLVADKIAALEGTEAALVLASGMAATAMTFLALARTGDHIVASTHLYGATIALLRDELPKRGIAVSFVDPLAGGLSVILDALQTNTRLVHLEMPTNPGLRVLDLRPIAEELKARGIPLSCDATFASPVNMRVAELGVDAVIQSATKYMGGHSDLIAGSVAGSRELIAEITHVSRLFGPSIDPHSAWLLDRGLRTLPARMQRHNASALPPAIHPALQARPPRSP